MPALTRIKGVLVQLVEIPGLIGGAADDRGGGRALLGVLRFADAIVYCARAGYPPDELLAVQQELARAEISKPGVLAITRADEASDAEIDALARAFPGLTAVRVSVIDPASLDSLREAIWALTGLIRVYLRVNGSTAEEPLALDPGATVADVADAVHHELGASFSGARVWGPSARFEGQRVGREHLVQDADTVEILR